MKGSEFHKRDKADVLILPFFQEEKCAKAAFSDSMPPMVAAALKTGDFSGKFESHALIYLDGEKEPRALFIGLGKKDELTHDRVRRAYAVGAGFVKQKAGVTKANVMTPKSYFSPSVEGMLLANYEFTDLKGDSVKNEPVKLFTQFSFIGASQSELKKAHEIFHLVSSVHLTRDLVNGNADDVTPDYLVKVAKDLSQQHGLKCTVFDKKRMEKEGMGLLLAVARSSFREPKLIFLEYRGNPGSNETVAIVGKGVTYDTGGLSLKPTAGMLDMKADMGGSGAVLGIMDAVSKLKIKKNVIGVIPTTENAIGSKAYKLGDVYKACNGKTVEIVNTDAEGRLILADALAYTAKHYKPSCMIDMATLTGACLVALGEDISALFTKDKKLLDHFSQASQDTGEYIWPLPLHDEYKKKMKSDFADIKNCGDRWGGSITAALFLQEFVEDIPWAHLDIAGPAFLAKAFGHHPKNATGTGVRLVTQFLRRL